MAPAPCASVPRRASSRPVPSHPQDQGARHAGRARQGGGHGKAVTGGVAFGCGSSGVASWVKEGSAGPVKLAPPFSDSVTDGLPPLRASNPTLSLWGRPEEAGGLPARVLGPAPRLGWGSVFGSLPGGLVSPRPKLVGAGPPPPPSGGGGLPLVFHGRYPLSRFFSPSLFVAPFLLFPPSSTLRFRLVFWPCFLLLVPFRWRLCFFF